MLDNLAPVGSHIALRKCTDLNWEDLYAGVDARLYNSGTAALAAALLAAKSLSDNVEEGEVILPAYGCPDLVSAAIFAGLKPVLVDLEPDSPNMSLAMVKDAVSRKTVAIVAVNFLGVPEQLQRLKTLAESRGAILIEDNAQWFPRPGCKLHGDMVITSFGRGKPVSVLGGGLLLIKKSIACEIGRPLPPSSSNRFLLAKLIAYNILITPALFGVIESMPLFSLGQTKYKVLECISGMPSENRFRLAENISIYLDRSIEVQNKIRAAVDTFKDHIIDVPHSALPNASLAPTLLRYPILTRSEKNRNSLLSGLRKSGLGASGFYGKPLIDIENVEDKVRLFSGCEQAKSFAARLITLPTHPMVTDKHLAKLEQVLSSHFHSATGDVQI